MSDSESKERREAFEKWYDASIWPGVFGGGNDSQWQAWKAARQSRPTSIDAEELVRRLEDDSWPYKDSLIINTEVAIKIIREMQSLCGLGLTDAKRQEEQETAAKDAGESPDDHAAIAAEELVRRLEGKKAFYNPMECSMGDARLIRNGVLEEAIAMIREMQSTQNALHYKVDEVPEINDIQSLGERVAAGEDDYKK